MRESRDIVGEPAVASGTHRVCDWPAVDGAHRCEFNSVKQQTAAADPWSGKEAMTSTLPIESLAPFGVAVDIDLSQPLAPEVIAELQRLYDIHHLLVFR